MDFWIRPDRNFGRPTRMQQGDIIFRLGGDDLSAGFGAVREYDLDLTRAGDDVVSGQDITALIDDHATANPYPIFFLVIFALGLDEDQGGENGLVDLGRKRRWWRGRGHRLYDALVNLILA